MDVNNNPIVPLMTLDEVAARLGVSKAWVRDHAMQRNPRTPVAWLWLILANRVG
jgi:hypothetical protein